MSKPNLAAIIKSTRDANSNITVLKDSKNIPVVITGYKDEDGDVIAVGNNLITNKPIEVKLKYQVRPDGSQTNRSMADIREFTPVGTMVIFTNCFEDPKNESRVTAYYARTPFNTVASDAGETKDVTVEVLPGRLVQTDSGRVAGVFYNFKDGVAITAADQVFTKAAELFKEKRGVYLRVRVNSPAEGVVQNEAFEFLPVIDSVVDPKTQQKVGVVNVDASLAKIKQSPINALWLAQLGDMQEYLGNEVNIDLMPISTCWGSAAAFRDGKKLPEQKMYGLGAKGGFFAPETHLYNDGAGQQRRNSQNVATNLIVSVLKQSKSGEMITTMLGANALGTKATFTSINNLPIVINGQMAFMPVEDMITKRMLKSDGTFVTKLAESPQNDQVKQVAPVESQAAQSTAQPEVAEKAVDVVIPELNEPEVAAVNQLPDLQSAEPDHDGEQVSGMDDLGMLEDIDIDAILSDMDNSEAPAQAAAAAMKP